MRFEVGEHIHMPEGDTTPLPGNTCFCTWDPSRPHPTYLFPQQLVRILYHILYEKLAPVFPRICPPL